MALRPSARLDERIVATIRSALTNATSYSYTSGSTHHFYHYPARFAPPIAHEVISRFSSPGEWVLDPFMGGGTTVIEGLALGRRTIGVDINALAHFVTSVRTRPISKMDEDVLRGWACLASEELTRPDVTWIDRVPVRNLPTAVGLFMSGAL